MVDLDLRYSKKYSTDSFAIFVTHKWLSLFVVLVLFVLTIHGPENSWKQQGSEGKYTVLD